jgi:hypothetical protein
MSSNINTIKKTKRTEVVKRTHTCLMNLSGDELVRGWGHLKHSGDPCKEVSLK